MAVVLTWFADRELPDERVEALWQRVADDLTGLVPDSYERHEVRTSSWGLLALHPPNDGVLHWQPAHAAEDLAVVTLGLPVGIDVGGGLLGLGGRVLASGDAAADVLPPFGVVAVAGGRRAVVQQDWLGMCRLFRGDADGLTVVANRPTLVARALGLPLEPDLAGWSSWAMAGHFGADTSPVRGVGLLAPGARLVGRRGESGGWALSTEQALAADDLVLRGVALRTRPFEEVLDVAADSITGVITGADDLAATELTLGLSGGKDSRLVAAAFVAAGRLPRLSTNNDTEAEGATAERLVAILRDQRGLDVEHRVFKAGAPAVVHRVGLHERVRRMQQQSDFQFPSSYTVRPVSQEGLPPTARAISFTGSGGELATGYWYLEHDTDDRDEAAGRHWATKRLLVDLGATERIASAEAARLDAVAVRGLELGLLGVELCDYVYLVERVRRWYTSAYVTGMMTPLLSPGFVTATFAVTAAQKRRHALHQALLRRYVPEWADVPFVLVSTGRTTATRVWEGDGLRTAADLLDTHQGRLPDLFRRELVEESVVKAARGQGTARHEKVLQQFTWAAIAAETFEPGTVRPDAPRVTWGKVLAARDPSAPATPKPPPVPPRTSALAARLRFLKQVPLVRQAWAVARRQVVARRRSGMS